MAEASIGEPTKSFMTVTHMSSRGQGGSGRAPSSKLVLPEPVNSDPDSEPEENPEDDDPPIQAVTLKEEPVAETTEEPVEELKEEAVEELKEEPVEELTEEQVAPFVEVASDTTLQIEESIPEPTPRWAPTEEDLQPKFLGSAALPQAQPAEYPKGPSAVENVEGEIENMEHAEEDTSICPAPIVVLGAMELLMAVVALIFTGVVSADCVTSSAFH
eukprot:2746644-Rhodomonas_salina.1